MTRLHIVRITTSLAALAASLLTTACATDAPDADADTGQSTGEIIGGTPIRTPLYDAVVETEETVPGHGVRQCTGTLITPTVVVTAKHCVIEPDLVPANTTVSIGFDIHKAKQVIPVASAAFEDTVTGGLIGLGSDVAVLHLARPVTGVTPFAYGAVDPKTVGKRYVAVGYGDQNNQEDFGTRTAGSMTLLGVGGNDLELIFGSFEEFVRQAPRMPDFIGLGPDELRKAFDESVLLPEYEAHIGGRAGDANNCFGDSGGPMLDRRNGRMTVVGVTSNGLASVDQICDFGGVDAVFGPAVIKFLDRETGKTAQP
jgi:Trypsin